MDRSAGRVARSSKRASHHIDLQQALLRPASRRCSRPRASVDPLADGNADRDRGRESRCLSSSSSRARSARLPLCLDARRAARSSTGSTSWRADRHARPAARPAGVPPDGPVGRPLPLRPSTARPMDRSNRALVVEAVRAGGPEPRRLPSPAECPANTLDGSPSRASASLVPRAGTRRVRPMKPVLKRIDHIWCRGCRFRRPRGSARGARARASAAMRHHDAREPCSAALPVRRLEII